MKKALSFALALTLSTLLFTAASAITEGDYAWEGHTLTLASVDTQPMFAPADMTDDQYAIALTLSVPASVLADDAARGRLYLQTKLVDANGAVYSPSAGATKETEYTLLFAVAKGTDADVLTLQLGEVGASGVPSEYVGEWTGSVSNINLSFAVHADGTGTYTFEQGGYHESYDFTLTVASETFSVQVPEVNQLGIVACEGRYAYADGVLTLAVRTTMKGGQVFEYTVPCRKIEAAGADDAQSAAIEKISGSWSISTGAFSYVDTGIGGFEGSFTVAEEGLRSSGNILQFDRSGDFHSEFTLVDDEIFAGESLNFTAYSGWGFVPDADPSDGDVLSGQLTFTPVTGDFEYALTLSADEVLTITVSELYVKQSVTTSEGYVTMSGEVPMTYVFTLVRTPAE